MDFRRVGHAMADASTQQRLAQAPSPNCADGQETPEESVPSGVVLVHRTSPRLKLEANTRIGLTLSLIDNPHRLTFIADVMPRKWFLLHQSIMHQGAGWDYDHESITQTLVNINFHRPGCISMSELDGHIISPRHPPTSNFFTLYVHPPAHIAVTVRRHREPYATRYRATVMQ